MDGYFREGQVGEAGILKISVTNIPELKKLLNQAKEEANQLQDTIRQLENFDLSIELKISEREI